MAYLRVKLVKSPIGYPKRQRETLKGMGLTRLNKEVLLKDTPPVRGMIKKVAHLVEVRYQDAVQS